MKKIDKKVLTINTINIILMKQSGTRGNNVLLTKESTGILAQLGEHLPYKQRVTEHTVHTRGVESSNLPSATVRTL